VAFRELITPSLLAAAAVRICGGPADLTDAKDRPMPYTRTRGPLTVVDAPTCLHLRSKGMYVTGQRDPGPAIGDGHCWCNRTQNVLGPDDALVARACCNASRTCYQAAP
jgi:hypothetical protein